jgi:hypothetical protein
VSIKYFHLVFITVAWLFCLGMAAWCFFMPENQGDLGAMLGGGIMLGGAIALIIYQRSAWRKLKKIYI